MKPINGSLAIRAAARRRCSWTIRRTARRNLAGNRFASVIGEIGGSEVREGVEQMLKVKKSIPASKRKIEWKWVGEWSGKGDIIMLQEASLSLIISWIR
jgi:hypothetical protein